MTNIIAFDPGVATGFAVGTFSDTEPLTRVAAGVITPDKLQSFGAALLQDVILGWDGYVVSEKFVLSSGNEFTADLTPVKVEGVLEFIFGAENVHWRSRTTKNQVPDKLLKELGWWVRGSDVDWEDGRDANDATIHMLGYVAFDLKHRPTLEAYFK